MYQYFTDYFLLQNGKIAGKLARELDNPLLEGLIRKVQ